jgi:hypothetical protein
MNTKTRVEKLVTQSLNPTMAQAIMIVHLTASVPLILVLLLFILG